MMIPAETSMCGRFVPRQYLLVQEYLGSVEQPGLRFCPILYRTTHVSLSTKPLVLNRLSL